MRKIIFLFVFVFLLSLVGCNSSETPTDLLSLTQINTSIPTTTQILATASPMTSPTIFPANQFDVSSILTQTPSPEAQCPIQNNSLAPDFESLFNKETMYGSEVERNIEQPVLNFLNSGGTPNAVIDAFANGFEGNNSKFFQQDLTNDKVPELIIDDFLLHIFGCRDRKYVLLLIVDPGEWNIKSSNIVFVQDTNKNGIFDLVISEWIGDINLHIPTTYRVMEWDGKKFKDLIIQPEFQSRYGAGRAGNGYVSIEGIWSYTESFEKLIELEDIDKNGTFELILRGGLPTHIDTINHGPWRAETNIYMWNGEGFVIYSVESSPPVYRFQAIQDADYAFFDENYEKAITLYQDVIFDDKLEWWSNDRYIHESEVTQAEYLSNPIPTPLPPNNSEYYYLSAYARYRIMLIYTKLGWLSDAEVIYKTLQEEYAPNQEGYIIAELAKVFWDEFKTSNDLSTSCSKAIDFTKLNAFEIFNYVGWVKTNESYDWIYHGWAKERNYIVEDICHFK